MAAGRRGSRDRGHGAGGAQEPRLCRDRRGAAAERALCGGGRRNHLRALLHVAPDLHRPELLAGRRRRSRGARDRARRRGRGAAGRCDRACDGPAVHPVCGSPARMDRSVPVEGGDHRIPRGSRHRRRDRGAAEAHRHVGRGRQRLARARELDQRPGRHRRDDGARRRLRARRHPRPATSQAESSGRPRPRGRRLARVRRVRPWRAWGRAGRRRAEWAPHPRASRRVSDRRPLPRDRDRGHRGAPDRVLPDGRGREGVRSAASLPHRRQPGSDRAGDGERRRRGPAGNAGHDQPLGQLPERVLWRADPALVAGHRGPGDRNAAGPRSLVLGPSEGGSRSGDHRRGRVRDDRRCRASPPLQGDALRLLDRGGGDHRRALGRRPRRGGDRSRPLARLAHLRRDQATDAAARP